MKFVKDIISKILRCKQDDRCKCPYCNEQMSATPKNLKSVDQGIYEYTCDNCNKTSKWNFDAPLPELLENE